MKCEVDEMTEKTAIVEIQGQIVDLVKAIKKIYMFSVPARLPFGAASFFFVFFFCILYLYFFLKKKDMKNTAKMDLFLI